MRTGLEREVPVAIEAEQPVVVDDDATDGTWSWIWPTVAEAPLRRSTLLFCAACSMTYWLFAVPVQSSWSSSRVGWPCASRKRCAWFAQDFSEHFLLQPVLDGVIALPAADVAEPFLDVDDVADVAVATLTRDGHVGRTYELTGPGCSPSPTWPPS